MSRARMSGPVGSERIVRPAQADARAAARAVDAVLCRWPLARQARRRPSAAHANAPLGAGNEDGRNGFRLAPPAAPVPANTGSFFPSRARVGAGSPSARQAGLSLVGLLVGTALGLTAVAAAGSLLAAGIRETRDTGLETRLVQDLRTAADIVTRDLRRAGHWAGAASGVRRDDGTSPLANPYAAFTPEAGASAVARFAYSRDAVDDHAVTTHERFGFRLRNGALELQLGEGNWQAITDAQSMTVTTFTVTPRSDEMPLDGHCPAACPTGSATCPPRLAVRSVDVALSGRAAGDARVVRDVRSRARLRADAIVGSCT